MKVLVVVDCQEYFQVFDNTELSRNIIEKIEEFKSRKDSIIFLEYDGYKPTIDSLVEAVENYEDVAFLTKINDSGAEEVMNYIHLSIPEIEEFQFCGVNLDACVFYTAKELGKEYPDIDMTILYEYCGARKSMEDAADYVLDPERQIPNLCLVDITGPMYF